MTSGNPSTDRPLPELVPLLEKYNLTWEQFQKKGRPSVGVREKRQAIVTELHALGTPWAEMQRITGFSLMGIQRLTHAVGNPASRANRAANAVRVGRAGRGRKKPWLSEQLQTAWADGKFDFHRGRVRSPEEREALHLASLRPEVRQKRSEAALKRWRNPVERECLLAFHRSEDERQRRSKDQARRMQENPSKWLRGIGAWAEAKKCSRSPIWTRSSYERTVVDLLDNDSSVTSYVYEPRVKLSSGRWMLPDFLVMTIDGRVTLLEVKASWVLNLPDDHKVQRRLREASSYAASMGWEFLIWTEKDFGDAGFDTS